MLDDAELRSRLFSGLVIPAHPLSLTPERRLDSRRQLAVGRYYVAAGAGGMAVGVHTTQFSIRAPEHNLLRPVLQIAAAAAGEVAPSARPLLIAGACGPLKRAVEDAELARELGYDAVLLSLGAFADADEAELIEACREVAGISPLFGFYLQPAVGGKVLRESFWRRLMEIDRLVAIKTAPFNRYQTLDVARALGESGRGHEIALYTGNDDNILGDLLMEYPSGEETLRFSGGLLGQWAVGTRRAVEMLGAVKMARQGGSIPFDLIRVGTELTEMNAAIFDAENAFAGCVPGINEVLRRQGLLETAACLDPEEALSPGQFERIDRVMARFPHLLDGEFARENLDAWLR